MEPPAQSPEPLKHPSKPPASAGLTSSESKSTTHKQKIDVRKVKLARKDHSENESLVLRLVGSPVNLMLFIIGSSPIVLVSDMLDWDGKVVVRVVIFALYVLAIAAGVFRFVYKRVAFFTSLRKSLTEIMAMLFFGCAAAAAFVNYFGQDQAVRAMIYAFSWAILGATWAWHRMERLELTSPRERLLLMLRGWALLAGIVCIWIAFAGWMSSTRAGHLMRNYSLDDGEFMFVLMSCGMLLTLPGLCTEGEVRGKKRTYRKRQAVATDSEASHGQ